MAKSVIVFGNVGVGGFEVDNRPVLMKWLAQQPVGTRFRATFEVTELDDRDRLKRRYWMLLREAGESLGNTPTEMHEAFWYSEFQEHADTVDHDLGQLSDARMLEYVQASERLAAKHGHSK